MNSLEARQLMDMLVDGDIRPEDVERLADHLAEHPDLVPELRADLRLSERLSQALCGTRTAEAFAAMMQTRISAEESADKFTSGVMSRITVRGEQVIRPSAWHRWFIPLAAAASLAIVAGVWWFSQRQDAGLGLRVAEVQRSEVRGQRSEVRDRRSDVRIQRSGGKMVAAVVGMELRQGDRVLVGTGGTVTLKYEGEETTIELHAVAARPQPEHGAAAGIASFGSENGGKQVNLAAGTLVCTAAPQKLPSEIQTPHAVARIVGTRFSLDVTDPRTVLAVQEGKVEFIRADEVVVVSSGQAAEASPAGLEMVGSGKTPISVTGMVLIPGGTNAGTDPDTQKPYSLTAESFLMDRYEVTKALWDEVAVWARDHGYGFDTRTINGVVQEIGQGKGSDHPVHSVSWNDCVTWCNARSEKDGFAPVYHADAACSVVWRGSGSGLHVKATADGYRLPTLVEWQYAARGGQPSHRFPWHDVETVDHSRANYWSHTRAPDDTSPASGCHPTYAVAPKPYTSPVGAFAPNAYGLYDLAGNVSEWCFDEVMLGAMRKHAGSAWNRPYPSVSGSSEEALVNDRNMWLGFRTVRTSKRADNPASSQIPATRAHVKR